MTAETPRVRIQELRLEGFRAFENARLSLDDLTVLVGRNGAGKSTLIDALEFLREALTDSVESALERRGGFTALARKTQQAKREMAIAVRLRVSSGFLRAVAKDTGLPLDLMSPESDLDIRYGFHLITRRGGAGFLVENEEAQVEQGEPSVSGRTRKISVTVGTQARGALELPLIAQHTLRYRVALEALRSSIGVYNFSSAAIRAEPPIGSASVLTRNGSNVGDVLKHVEKNKDDLAWVIRHLAAITPGLIGVKSGTAAGRRIVQFFQSSGGKTNTRFEIGDMSDGTLRCLAILLALRQRPAPAIVCIDEIEDSVHPAALAVLLDAVAASTERCQILLTSHSPEALSHPAVTAGRIRVVEWHDGKSEIFRLSPGAEEMSRPPRSVGRLLRTNSLFTAEQPERVEGDFFEGA